MLRLLQNVYLSPLLVHFDRLHIFLLDGFYRHFLGSSLVRCQLYESELTFAQVIFNVVVVKKVRVADDALKNIQPLFLHIQLLEVQDPTLIWWEHNFDRMQVTCFRI